MLEERTLDLINADIDGELSGDERRELEALLESSEEARALRAEFLRLSNLLDAQEQLQPPPDLAGRILEDLRLPRPAAPAVAAGWFSSFRPAQAGLAFAAGLLATVAWYEMTAGQAPMTDTASMVGTLVANPRLSREAALDSLSLEVEGVSGQVTLSRSGTFYLLNFEIDSGRPVEIEIAFAEAGLGFGGLAHTITDAQSAGGSYVITGGALRVENQGRKAFTVFLPEVAEGTGDGRTIDVGISSRGAELFNGSLRG
jgi:hypothetical protein